MKKKIFITGISSLLVKEIIALIDTEKYSLIGLTRDTNKVKLGSDIELSLIEKDILDMTEEEYDRILKNCSMVIHGAAITHSRNKKTYLSVNFEATKTLVNSAKRNQIDNFIFLSSNTAGRNSGAYGESKLLAENYIKDHINNWTNFRITEVFGGIKNEGIEKLIEDALSKNQVLCPKDVPTKLCPIHVKDAARIMHQLSFLEPQINKTTIISGSQLFSYEEIIKLGGKHNQQQPRILFIPKLVMQMIKVLVSLIPFRLSIVPDQVDRLYSEKSIVTRRDTTISLESYIEEVASSN
jgi:nucleoside-diphosphate-sugar epimerase